MLPPQQSRFLNFLVPPSFADHVRRGAACVRRGDIYEKLRVRG